MNYTEKNNSLSPPPPPYESRLSQDSFVSDYDPDIKDLIPDASAAKILDLVNTKSHINIRITDSSSGEVLFYVDNSSFTPGKPDVTLCRGGEKGGTVVGVSRWSGMYSKYFMVGVGDPAKDQAGTIWEEVRTEKSIHPEFKWNIGPSNNRTTFAWHRIRNKEEVREEDDDANTFSRKNFKLVQCQSGEVLATLTSQRFKSWNKIGKLVIKVDGNQRGWGEDWESMLILSVLGILEMSRRRGRQRRSGGGSGGP